MKILRLFVNDHLDAPINWILIENEGTVDGGSSTWEELIPIENAHIEVYLTVNCCGIHKAKTTGIKTNKITDDILLGLLEDMLVEEIEEVHPVILKTDDEIDITYVAVFNKQFYNSLMLKLLALNSSVRYVQSFAYSTIWHENEWTIFINQEQQFIRTSEYEYYLLDDTQPISKILEHMVNTSMHPKKINIYADNPSNQQKYIENNFHIPCEVHTELNFLPSTWNFYNHRSTKFHFKIDANTKYNVKKLSKSMFIFIFFLTIFWTMDVLIIEYKTHLLNSSIKKSLTTISPTDNITTNSVQATQNKINQIKHQKGVYTNNDLIPLLNTFLNTASSVGSDSIVQIVYSEGNMDIFLNGMFNHSQFESYQNILLSQNIKATITEYKLYKQNKTNNSTNNNNPNAITDQQSQEIDAQWVVTLKSN